MLQALNRCDALLIMSSLSSHATTHDLYLKSGRTDALDDWPGQSLAGHSNWVHAETLMVSHV